MPELLKGVGGHPRKDSKTVNYTPAQAGIAANTKNSLMKISHSTYCCYYTMSNGRVRDRLLLTLKLALLK